MKDHETDDHQICRMLLVFETHGALVQFEAYILEDMGYLDSEMRQFSPFTEDTAVLALTSAGNKAARKARNKWNSDYAPIYKVTAEELEDPYLKDDAKDYFWGFSLDRILKEAKAGKLGKVIDRSI